MTFKFVCKLRIVIAILVFVLLAQKTDWKALLSDFVPSLEPLINFLIMRLLIEHTFFLVHPCLTYGYRPETSAGRSILISPLSEKLITRFLSEAFESRSLLGLSLPCSCLLG